MHLFNYGLCQPIVGLKFTFPLRELKDHPVSFRGDMMTCGHYIEFTSHCLFLDLYIAVEFTEAMNPSLITCFKG